MELLSYYLKEYKYVCINNNKPVNFLVINDIRNNQTLNIEDNSLIFDVSSNKIYFYKKNVFIEIGEKS